MTTLLLILALQTAPAPRDARAAAVGTASLSGTVVSADAEARPVRRARVTCSASELTAGLTTITDDRGRFTFARLPAGRYTIAVTRDAWVATAYGARGASRIGSAIPLGDGQKADVVVRMTRGAVITGMLLDESGQPSVNTSVYAMRNTMQNGERRFLTFGTTGTTDDRGIYRVYGLPPGDYIVGAAGRAGAAALQGAELRLTTDLDVHHATTAGPLAPAPPERGVAFSSTYFPGTPISTQASVVTLRAGEERDGIDFALQLMPTARIEGTVSLPDGGPPSSAQLTLLASGQTAFPGIIFDGMRTTRVAGDGTFSISGVAPGHYTLLARATTPQILWAVADLSVDGERITGLSLSLQPGMTVAGQVRFDGTLIARPADPSSIRVMLQPVQSQGSVTMSPNGVSPDVSGRFTIAGVTPGRYRLTASAPGAGRPGGWMLRSAIVNGQDTLDVPLVLQPNQSIADAVVTFSDRPSQLTGALQNAAGGAAPEYTVILFPADQSLWMPQARRIQGVRPSADGAYAFRNLAPGTYLVAAADDVESGEWFDPAVLQRLTPTAIRITIAEGEQKIQDIRVGASGS
jgi:uncharacterized protein (DUF2141 family)